MALHLTSRLQVTAHYFWNRRNAAALSHHGVRLEYDPEQRAPQRCFWASRSRCWP
jgi:hypothetical protein